MYLADRFVGGRVIKEMRESINAAFSSDRLPHIVVVLSVRVVVLFWFASTRS